MLDGQTQLTAMFGAPERLSKDPPPLRVFLSDARIFRTDPASCLYPPPWKSTGRVGPAAGLRIQKNNPN